MFFETSIVIQELTKLATLLDLSGFDHQANKIDRLVRLVSRAADPPQWVEDARQVLEKAPSRTYSTDEIKRDTAKLMRNLPPLEIGEWEKSPVHDLALIGRIHAQQDRESGKDFIDPITGTVLPAKYSPVKMDALKSLLDYKQHGPGAPIYYDDAVRYALAYFENSELGTNEREEQLKAIKEAFRDQIKET